MLEYKTNSNINLRNEMPYLVSSIIAVVTAMIILLTRYEADDSAITAEIERTKSMFITVDGFVNTYIQSGGDMTAINFEKLYDDGILLGNIKMTKPTALASDDVTDSGFKSVLIFPKSEIKWQIVPITTDDTGIKIEGVDKDFSSSAGSGYKLFIDFSNNETLKSKSAFSESFLARELCENNFFGTAVKDAEEISSTNTITINKANSEAKMVCIIFK